MTSFKSELPNTSSASVKNIYFGDSLKRTKGIFFNGLVIEAGMVNDTVIWDVSAGLTDAVREYFETDTGLVTATNTRTTRINDMSLLGRSVIENNKLLCGTVTTITIIDETNISNRQVIEVNKAFNRLPNNVYDYMDVDSGMYYHRVCKFVIDGTYKWRAIANYNGYEEYALIDYLGAKPECLTVQGLLDTSMVKPITALNALCSGGIVATDYIASEISGKNCIFVNNGRIHLRLSDEIVDSPYASNLTDYLSKNPITLLLEYTQPKTEQMVVPELTAYFMATGIQLDKGENELSIHPYMRVGLPINLQEAYNSLMNAYHSLLEQQNALLLQQELLEAQRVETDEAMTELMLMLGGEVYE